jgi:hypothetical protein
MLQPWGPRNDFVRPWILASDNLASQIIELGYDDMIIVSGFGWAAST